MTNIHYHKHSSCKYDYFRLNFSEEHKKSRSFFERLSSFTISTLLDYHQKSDILKRYKSYWLQF